MYPNISQNITNTVWSDTYRYLSGKWSDNMLSQCVFWERTHFPSISHYSQSILRILPSDILGMFQMGYLNDKRNIRRGHTRVFIHRNQSICDIYQSHISKWRVEVVKTAYLSSDEDLPKKVTTHELRALAVLWAYNYHIALEDVLSAAFWWSLGSSRCHFRDLAQIVRAVTSLGLVVAAQHLCGR